MDTPSINDLSRRGFLAGTSAGAALTLGAPARALGFAARPAEVSFSISLAQWSLHRALRSGELDNLDFAKTARSLGIGAVEYVNSFFKDKAADDAYLTQMRERAADEGVQSLLIMVDGEGPLAAADEAERTKAVANHHRWIDAAAKLGCHSIRVNAAGGGEREEVAKRAADSLVAIADYAEPVGLNVIVENHGGLSSDGSWLAGGAGERKEVAKRAADSLVTLADYAAPVGLNVIVENHGGLSSDGSWLSQVMRLADHPRVGTLPDFGNFHVGDGAWYDRYKGVTELMPWAKAVSAKSHEFDEQGNETRTDYKRMLGLVLDAGYSGWIGIEYEGTKHPELEGIKLTRALLERVREGL